MRVFTARVFPALLANVLVLGTAPAQASALVNALLNEESVTCDAVALDGDTLLCHLTAPENHAGRSLRVRLWGVSAPEMRDTDGWHSRAILDERFLYERGLTLGQQGLALSHQINGLVSCTPKARHKSRLVAICQTASGADLGEIVIESGYATEHRAYTREGPQADPDLAARYAAAERTAVVSGYGLWRQGIAPTYPARSRPNDTNWRDWAPALMQALLSALAVFAAALVSQRFTRALHNDNIKREQAVERRIARNHMLPVVIAWTKAQDLAGEMVAAMEQLRLVNSEGGVNDEGYQHALSALDEATRLAEAEFGDLEIPRDALTYLHLEELDGLVGGKLYGEAGTRDARKAFDAMCRLRDSTNNPRNYRANPDLSPQKLEELGQRHLESGIDQLQTSRVHIQRIIEGLVNGDRVASDGEPVAKRS